MTTTRHKYTRLYPPAIAYEKLSRALFDAKRQAFTVVSEAVPPGVCASFIYREINRLVRDPFGDGKHAREIGCIVYIAFVPFTPSEVAAIMHDPASSAEDGVIDIDLIEGGSDVAH